MAKWIRATKENLKEGCYVSIVKPTKIKGQVDVYDTKYLFKGFCDNKCVIAVPEQTGHRCYMYNVGSLAVMQEEVVLPDFDIKFKTGDVILGNNYNRQLASVYSNIVVFSDDNAVTLDTLLLKIHEMDNVVIVRDGKVIYSKNKED